MPKHHLLTPAAAAAALLLLLLQGGEYSIEGNMVARNVLGVADQWAVTGEIGNALNIIFSLLLLLLLLLGLHILSTCCRVASTAWKATWWRAMFSELPTNGRSPAKLARAAARTLQRASGFHVQRAPE
jgi:hypothetical protein